MDKDKIIMELKNNINDLCDKIIDFGKDIYVDDPHSCIRDTNKFMKIEGFDFPSEEKCNFDNCKKCKEKYFKKLREYYINIYDVKE